MKLRALLEGVPWTGWDGPEDAEVGGIAYQADAVKAGDVFCTWAGTSADGHAHAPRAVERGAAALVVERGVLPGRAIPVVRVPSGRRALAGLAANFHGHPAGSLAMAGITGTNGKTSTAFLLHHLLECMGRRCGLIGTIRHQSGRDILPSTRTTPEALDLQALLARMRDDGCRAAVMEVSSHALDQGRAEGIAYRVAVFTNLTRDHLDYHGTMERYFSAKSLLFTGLRPGSHAVVNVGDEWGRRLLGLLPAGVEARPYAVGGGADSTALDLRVDAGGLSFVWQRPGGSHALTAPWIGAFNAANILAAAEAACALGADPGDVVRWIAQAPPVPGRMERVGSDLPFTVLVDYAHTDDALRNVLTTLRPLTGGRLRVLAGCGGDRDRTKRPLMARAVEELADECVFTADNPRSEDPGGILEEMLAGVADRSKVRVIPDRAEAIDHLIATARPGDVVVLAGKGHETTQEIAGVKHPFSDAGQARAALARHWGGAR